MRNTLIDPCPRTIFHPRTGHPVWIPRGGDGTEDESAGTNDEGVKEEPEKETEADEGSGKKPDTVATVSKSDFDKLQEAFTRMQAQLSASDKNKAAAQKKLDDLQRKERTELENAKADLAKAAEETTGWKTKFTNLARTNAFLTESMKAKITWHNPTLALKAAEVDTLEITDDGAVTGMDTVIKKLAKDQPYLVNSAKGSDDGDEKDKDTKSASGSNVGTGKGKNNGKPGQMTEEELIKRFPALKG